MRPAAALLARLEHWLEGRRAWTGALAVLALLPWAACWGAVGGNWSRSGNDMGYFLRELEQTSRGEVLGWVTGPWIGHELFRYYRPVTSLVIYGEYLAFGLNPAAWQALSLVLHAATTVALALLLRRVLHSPAAALVGAAVWTLRPRMPLTIEWVPAQTDLLAGFFALGSLLGLHVYLDKGCRYALGGAAVGALLAMGCKEVALVLPGLGALLILNAPNVPVRRKAALIAGAAVLTGAFMAWRWLALAGAGYVPGTGSGGPGAVAGRLGGRLLQFLLPGPVYERAVPSVLAVLIATVTAVLAWPFARRGDGSKTFIVAGTGLIALMVMTDDPTWWLLPSNLWGLGTGVGCAALMLLAARRRPRLTLLALGWGIVAWLPTYRVVYGVAGNVQYLPDTYWALAWGVLTVVVLGYAREASPPRSSTVCEVEGGGVESAAARASPSELSRH